MGTCLSLDHTKLLESLCISHYFRGVVIYSNVISSTLFQSKRFFKLSFLRIAGKYRPFKKVMSLRTSSALTSGNPSSYQAILFTSMLGFFIQGQKRFSFMKSSMPIKNSVVVIFKSFSNENKCILLINNCCNYNVSWAKKVFNLRRK